MVQAATEAKYYVCRPNNPNDPEDCFWLQPGSRWIHQRDLLKGNALEQPIKVTKEQALLYQQLNPAIVAITDDGEVLKAQEAPKPAPPESTKKQSRWNKIMGRMKQRSTQSTHRTIPDYINGETADRPRRKGGWLRLLRYPMYFALGLLGAFCIYRSAGVFIIAFKKLGLDNISSGCSTFPLLPLIGGMLHFGCLGFAKVIAAILAPLTLIALTIGESLPVIAFFSPEAIRDMVEHLRFSRKSDDKLSHQEGDNDEIRFLVNRHNSISETTFRSLVILGLICFGIEMVIVFIGRGSGANLREVMIDTFGVEACLTGFLVLRNWFRGRPQPKTIKYYG